MRDGVLDDDPLLRVARVPDFLGAGERSLLPRTLDRNPHVCVRIVGVHVLVSPISDLWPFFLLMHGPKVW